MIRETIVTTADRAGRRLGWYDPKTNHVTVVSHSMLGDSWMGSHFTNDDLVKETKLSEHYDHTLLRKWTGKSELGDDSTLYRIRLQPKPTAPWELYDLRADVSESNNLAQVRPDILAKLQAYAKSAHTPAVEGTFTSTVLHERDRAAKFGGNPPAPKAKGAGKKGAASGIP